MVAVITADAYPFLAFSTPICHTEDTGRCVLWFHCGTSDSTEPKLWNSDQEASQEVKVSG